MNKFLVSNLNIIAWKPSYVFHVETLPDDSYGFHQKNASSCASCIRQEGFWVSLAFCFSSHFQCVFSPLFQLASLCMDVLSHEDALGWSWSRVCSDFARIERLNWHSLLGVSTLVTLISFCQSRIQWFNHDHGDFSSNDRNKWTSWIVEFIASCRISDFRTETEWCLRLSHAPKNYSWLPIYMFPATELWLIHWHIPGFIVAEFFEAECFCCSPLLNWLAETAGFVWVQVHFKFVRWFAMALAFGRRIRNCLSTQ